MFPATPANADVWCFGQVTDTYAKNTCDADLPQSSTYDGYQTWIVCTDGRLHIGPFRWWGEGYSQVNCPANRFVTDHGIFYVSL